MLFRIAVLASICITQAFMMWKFINFQLRRWREHSAFQAPPLKRKPAMTKGRSSRKGTGRYWLNRGSTGSESIEKHSNWKFKFQILQRQLCYLLFQKKENHVSGVHLKDSGLANNKSACLSFIKLFNRTEAKWPSPIPCSLMRGQSASGAVQQAVLTLGSLAFFLRVATVLVTS